MNGWKRSLVVGLSCWMLLVSTGEILAMDDAPSVTPLSDAVEETEQRGTTTADIETKAPPSGNGMRGFFVVKKGAAR